MYSFKNALLAAACALCGTMHGVVTDAAAGEAGDQSEASRISTSNDNNNYNSDRLTWRHAIRVASSPGGKYLYCLPAHTTLIGEDTTLEPDTEDAQYTGTSNTNQNVKISSQWLKVHLAEQDFPWGTPKNVQHGGGQNVDGFVSPDPSQCSELPPGDSGTSSMNGNDGAAGAGSPAGGNASSPATAVGGHGSGTSSDSSGATTQPAINGFQNLYEGVDVYVSEDDLKDAQRVGWEYGALAVPFKLQTSKGGTFTSATSVGPYLGYRLPLWDSGIVFSPVGFIGAAPISVSTTTKGMTNSQELAAISYGGGVVATIKDSFQVGLIVGADHVNPNSNYPFNDKLWVSFAIGYSFAQ